jgi:hypothetical protein
MMAKIVKGQGFKGVVNYILDKAKEAEILDTNDVRLKSTDTIIQSFIFQSELNPGLTKPVGHISLDFSAQDKEKLTNGFMVQIAKDYMGRMGILDTQYLIARHYDKEHPHIHLVFNRVDNNGKTISDRNDRFRSEKICKELTREYGLYFASGKEKVKENRLREPDKTKYEIYNSLKTTVPNCQNWHQLISELKDHKIGVTFKFKGKTDEIQGVIFDKNGYSITGSKVDRQFSYSKIDHQLRVNALQLHSSESHHRHTLPVSIPSGSLVNDFLYQLRKSSYEENRKKNENIPHINRRKGLRR